MIVLLLMLNQQLRQPARDIVIEAWLVLLFRNLKLVQRMLDLCSSPIELKLQTDCLIQPDTVAF